ncbi:FecR family protein [Sphingomonas oryzagri]
MSLPNDNQPGDRDEQAALWCLTFAEGPLAPVEQAAFESWAADPVNAFAFDEAISVWNATDILGQTPELIHFRTTALESFRRENGRRWTKGVSTRWYRIGAIAALFLLALISALTLYNPTTDYRTGIGERRIVMLDDGSKLSLDGDSEVRVRLLKDRRELKLVRGRAKFDVFKDPLRPFAVTVGGRIVVATGTSFSVELRSDQLRVLLYEGHVAVLNRINDLPVPQNRLRASAADVLLTPGRELVAPLDLTSGASVTETDPARSLAWESGQLSFDDEPLDSAIEQVNRYTSHKIALADRQLANRRVSGLFTAGDTQAFLDALTSLSSIRASKNGDVIVLSPR